MRKGLIFILLLLCMVFSLSGVVASEIDGNGKISADLNKFNHDISSSAVILFLLLILLMEV